MIDKEMFPSWRGDLQNWRADTVFWHDFTVAEGLGEPVVSITFANFFDKRKGSVKDLVELCIVTNEKCWYWYERGNEELSRKYGEWYHRCRDYAFSDESGFTREEQTLFYDVID